MAHKSLSRRRLLVADLSLGLGRTGQMRSGQRSQPGPRPHAHKTPPGAPARRYASRAFDQLGNATIKLTSTYSAFRLSQPSNLCFLLRSRSIQASRVVIQRLLLCLQKKKPKKKIWCPEPRYAGGSEISAIPFNELHEKFIG